MRTYGLEGRVALVTGAAQGIGLGIARRFVQEGCRLIVNDIQADRLAVAQRELAESGHDVHAIAADVAAHEDVRRMFAEIEERYGSIDILVNNAARVTARRWLGQVDEEFFDEVLRVNVKSIFLCARAAAKLMAGHGGGAIVNLSSVGAARAFRASLPYVTSKGAVEAQTRALAMDLAPYNIRVNAVGPGSIVTEAWDKLLPAELERRNGMVPLGRPGQTSDVAATVAFLASPDAGYITGQVIYVDGGMLCQNYSPCAEIPGLIGPPPPDFVLEEE